MGVWVLRCEQYCLGGPVQAVPFKRCRSSGAVQAVPFAQPVYLHKGYAVHMSSTRTPQMMKAATAAKKLGIYLPATPEEFQNSEISRTELNQLLQSPPEWMQELRQNGPHPRLVVASKLGVSITGLARSGITDPLTTTEIKELLQAPPAWLVTERATHAGVHAENRRLKERAAAEREKQERSAKH